MPYQSKAQQRLFHAKEQLGEIPASTVKEFDKKTDFSKLPERKKEAYVVAEETILKRYGLWKTALVGTTPVTNTAVNVSQNTSKNKIPKVQGPSPTQNAQNESLGVNATNRANTSFSQGSTFPVTR
jgi:hypothetical protein